MKFNIKSLFAGLVFLLLAIGASAQVTTRAVLKTYFEVGDLPKSSEYRKVLDSYFHLSEDSLALTKLEGIDGVLNTNTSLTGATNRNLASTLALKTYIDNQVAAGQIKFFTTVPTGNATYRIGIDTVGTDSLYINNGYPSTGAWSLLATGGGGGSGITDGDKGDITVSSSGANWQVDAGAIGTTEIADLAITSAKIAGDAVTATQIVADGVGSSEIGANAVGNSEMADNAVGSAEIIAESIAAVDIDTGAVTTSEILDATVAWGDLAQAVKDSIGAGGGTATDTTNIAYLEIGTDTIVPYPDSMLFRPFDIYRNGSIYHISPDFDLQARAGVQVATTYYVDINTGNDASAGTSWGTALKSLHVAIAKTDVDRIYVAKGVYPYANAWRNQASTRDLEIIGDLTQGVGDSIWITKQMNEKLTTGWTGVGSYYWAKYTVSPDTIGTVYDSTNADIYGDATALTLVATTALVNSTANSYRVNGDTIFVHTFDNRAPDSHVWLMGKNGSISGLNGVWTAQKTLYVKNICFRQGSIYTSGSSEGCRIYLDSINIWGGGSFFDGMSEVIILNSVFRTNGGDLLNYDPESGYIPNVAEYNVRAYNTTQAGCTNCQASTAHGGTSIIRVNGQYKDTNGQNAADVDGGNTLMYGCTFSNARAASSQGYYAGGASSGFSWLERCVFVNQQASNDDIYAEAGQRVFTRFNTPDEGNAGPGTYAAYTPSETFTNRVSEMMETITLENSDKLYVAKNNGGDEVSASISASNLFTASGALLKPGNVEGALTSAQKFRKGIEINGSTGAALNTKALSATKPALRLDAATGQTGNRLESYNASGVKDFIQMANGSILIGDSTSGAGSNFAVLNSGGNQVYRFGGTLSTQLVQFRITSGLTDANSWYFLLQGNADNGDLFLANSSALRFRFIKGGTLSAAAGYQVNGAAANRHVLIGDGTRGVFRALVTADISDAATGLWKVGGNATTDPTIGTNNTEPLHFETAGTRRMSIPSSGIASTTTATKALMLSSNDSLQYMTVQAGAWSDNATLSNVSRTDTVLNGGVAYGRLDRKGNMVFFTLRFEVGLGADTTSNIIFMPLPVASNFTSPSVDCMGTADISAQGVYGGNPIKVERTIVYADDTGDRIAVGYTVDRQGATYPTNRVYISVSGSYEIK